MNFINTFSLRILLAFTLLCGAGQAMASPVFRVTIDTASLAGQSGYLDFLLLGLAGAEPVEANLGNFTGSFAAGSFASGDASGSVGTIITVGNDQPWNEFGQWANFGGMFTFDLSFSAGSGTGADTNLCIALLDSNLGYLGTAGDIVTFAVKPGADITFSSEAAVATVGILPEANVPEPSTILQGLTGLLLMGAVARRRVRGTQALSQLT